MKLFKNEQPYYLGASIICGDPLHLDKELELLKKGGIDSLHFDVMDGDFVPRLGLYPEMLKAIKSKVDIPADVHLMIKNPKKYIPTFIAAGANLISIHAEAVSEIAPVIKLIKTEGILAGVALNPETPLSVLDEVADEIDLIMIMAICPGILGQKLTPETYQKISDTRKKFVNRPEVIIEVDGGVTPETAPEMIRRGANLLVCGTGTIYRPQEDTLENKVREVRSIIDKSIA